MSYENGVVHDDVKAVEWYTKAAKQGDSDAQSNLGLMYKDGTGVPKDIPKAYSLLSIASVLGDFEAKKSLKLLGNLMTSPEIQEGQSLSRKMWKEYKD